MLKELPKIGQTIEALKTHWSGEEFFEVEGETYLVEGYYKESGNPYFKTDGGVVMISKDSFHLYKLFEDNIS